MSKLILATLCMLAFAPIGAYADSIEKFSFTTDPQSIAAGAASGQITIEAEDANGVPVNGNTVCMQVTSSSQSGEFSTNAANWSAEPIRILALTLSSSQYRRNFYYRDSANGTHTLRAQAALRPGTTCTTWSPESGVQWTATHSITVGGNQTQNDQQTDTSTTTSTSQTTQAPTSSYVPPPEPTIFADAGSDRTVIVGADVEFDGRAYNRNKESVDHVRFLWNFGDGATAEGPSVLHHFEYPGQYAVMLYIAEDRTSVSDKIIVTAEPARLAFSAISDGSVSIQNLAGRDLDLSRWIVRQLGREFMLPEHSVILAGQSMHISQRTLGFWSQLSAELDYPNGVMALRAGESTTDAPDIPAPAPSPVAPVSKAPLAAYTDAPSSVLDSELVPSEESDRISATDTLTSASSTEVAAAASALSGGSYTWWLGALGLALAGGGALLAARRAGRREWDIIEEK